MYSAPRGEYVVREEGCVRRRTIFIMIFTFVVLSSACLSREDETAAVSRISSLAARASIHGAPETAAGAPLGLPFPIPPKCTVS